MTRRNRKRKAPPVSLAMPTTWDQGADGPANQDRLRTEPATDFDPETGKETPNPNGVKRRRRDDWVTRYLAAGKLNHTQAANAIRLRMASEGMRERDPLAAIGEIRSGGGDPLAARIDARRYFHTLWASVPMASRPVVERVAIENLPVFGGPRHSVEAHFRRLVIGLDAISLV